MLKDKETILFDYERLDIHCDDLEDGIYKLTENPVSIAALLDELKRCVIEKAEIMKTLYDEMGIENEDEALEAVRAMKANRRKKAR